MSEEKFVRIQSRRRKGNKRGDRSKRVVNSTKKKACVWVVVSREKEKREEKRERAMQHNIPFLSLIQHISNFNLYVM